MNRLMLLVVAAFAVAALVASRLGGAQGSGVLVGYALGAGLSGLSFLYTRHVLATRPERVFVASVAGFLAKLAALLFGALAFRFLPAAAERVDWQSFVVAFAAAVALVLPFGTALAVRERRARVRPQGVSA